MRGDEHYREAERIIDHAEESAEAHDAEWYANAMRAAQVHATLAHAAAVIDAADHEPNSRRLISRPMRAADGDPAYSGTPWGRAFYGDPHLDSTQEH